MLYVDTCVLLASDAMHLAIAAGRAARQLGLEAQLVGAD